MTEERALLSTLNDTCRTKTWVIRVERTAYFTLLKRFSVGEREKIVFWAGLLLVQGLAMWLEGVAHGGMVMYKRGRISLIISVQVADLH